jgi:predicted transposase/invertase (TIGR01784 family)
VFKRLFGESPELLVALINDLRPDLPEIVAVEILNPGINAEELSGKCIVLDVLARDAEGHAYNVEIQVRRHEAWNARALYYLARLLSQQLNAGEDYEQLRAAVGIHLLDFDLFKETEAQKAQAVWRFEMRDARQPTVTLGNRLQLTLIELKKADRLSRPAARGPAAASVAAGETDEPDTEAPVSERLSAWVTFFEHWREERTMASIEHAPIQEALNRVRQLSADEEAQRLAFVRERAQRDELSWLKEAREKGRQEGRQDRASGGRQEGRQEGEQIGGKGARKRPGIRPVTSFSSAC